MTVIEATIISFNAWFKAKNIPLYEKSWKFSDEIPKNLMGCMEIIETSERVTKLLDKEAIKSRLIQRQILLKREPNHIKKILSWIKRVLINL